MKSISKMAEPPKNGVRMVVFLTEVDFTILIRNLIFQNLHDISHYSLKKSIRNPGKIMGEIHFLSSERVAQIRDCTQWESGIRTLIVSIWESGFRFPTVYATRSEDKNLSNLDISLVD